MRIKFLHICRILFFLLIPPVLYAQQIVIPRVESMPNLPQPFEMRNWRQVALDYDTFVFDLNKSGQYLPLIWTDNNGVNYPNHSRFGIHTVVGTPFPLNAEAINALPAVIGAGLCGVDKSDQNGRNWVLMCEEWFNRRPQENVYLNGPVTSSGNDWWYDTMPNVFFYQLNDLYPGTGDFDFQFTSIADRWLQAVQAMGGSTTPWQVPYMNYRAWHLADMTPNNSGVPEPEAAGAIAWILYNAWIQTADENYRIGAEWAMEFLNGWSSNPSYELQLPYGVYTAARMNAELGTIYDVEKLVNWCFNIGPLRQWGVITGSWGGYDCYGLVGEALGEGQYAFTMNGFQMAAALIPMVRYDDRFAAAIGKWVLNLANASRLFYPDFLPDYNQDSGEWAHQYDSLSVIAHEAMRRDWNGVSPYATGDAVSGGWGATNLALYSSSHVGYLGAVLDTTEVPGILILDLLKTDFYHNEAYPSFLVYNPHVSQRSITLNTGNSTVDIYDTVENSFIAVSVSGPVAVDIPADVARVLVLVPAGGVQRYELDRFLVNDVVVDYRAGQAVVNHPPRIKALAADAAQVESGRTIALYCTAEDADGDSLNYSWQVSAGTISGIGDSIQWTAPDSADTVCIRCLVSDPQGAADSAAVQIDVQTFINHDPLIENLNAVPRKLDLQASTSVRCLATDADNDSLQYEWSAKAGSFSGNGAIVEWTAPDTAGNYYLACKVTDSHGGFVRDSIRVMVRDFSQQQTGSMIAWYPLDGNAQDAGGNGHHGSVNGAVPVADRFGNNNSAFWFDGVNDNITVPNHDSLNYQQAISISFWMQIGEFYEREAHPLSHGSWQNRWKVSIGSRRLRWTIKTDSPQNGGVIDLDSESLLQTFTDYHVVVIYDGTDMEIWINGQLDAFASWSGNLLPSPVDFLMGQVLPSQSQYNFKGILDDVRIFDYGLTVDEIRSLYSATRIYGPLTESIPNQFFLYQNYPNPFNPLTKISFDLPTRQFISLQVYNSLGQMIVTLIESNMPAGHHTCVFDAGDIAAGIYYYQLKGEYIPRQTRKMLLLK